MIKVESILEGEHGWAITLAVSLLSFGLLSSSHCGLLLSLSQTNFDLFGLYKLIQLLLPLVFFVSFLCTSSSCSLSLVLEVSLLGREIDERITSFNLLLKWIDIELLEKFCFTLFSLLLSLFLDLLLSQLLFLLSLFTLLGHSLLDFFALFPLSINS